VVGCTSDLTSADAKAIRGPRRLIGVPVHPGIAEITPNPIPIMARPRLKFAASFAACVAILFAVPPLPAQSATPAAPARTTTDLEPIELSPFVVNSSADEGYRATNALSGTRFNTALIDLPKPVDVITSEFISDIGAIDLGQAVAYSSSITEASAGGADDITGSNFNVRGYNTFTTYRNGYRSFGIVDPINVDRIEVIKGPSSVFSGQIEPGGTINVITKRPSTTPSGSLGFRYGSFDSKRVDLSYTGPLNAKKTVAVRAAAALSHTGYNYDFSGLNKLVIGTGLSWKISSRTELLLDAQYVTNQNHPVATARIINVARTGYEPNIPDSFNRNGPYARSYAQQYSGTSDLMHRFSDVWSFRVGGYYRYQSLQRLRDTGSAVSVVSPAVLGARLLNRTGSNEPNADSFVASATGNLMGTFHYAGLTHRMNLGEEYYYEVTRNDVLTRSFTGVAALNIDRPDYSTFLLNPDPLTYPPSDLRRTFSVQTASSISNLFSLLDGRLLLLQGLRYSVSDDEQKNLRRPNPTRRLNRISATVPNYGVTLKLRPDLALFASYAESYLAPSLQASTVDFAGNGFPPTTGKGTDFGVKFDLFGGRISGNFAAFSIDRENTLIADPLHPGFNLAEGLTKSRGLDGTVAVRATGAWSILVGYAYTDARLVNGSDPGGRVGNIPMHKFTLWNRYKFKTGPMKGVGVGVGVIFNDERRGNSALADLPGLASPGYTIYNANLTYERKVANRPWTFGLQFNNLTDKKYYQSAAGLGDPFTVAGTLRIAFR
jgi:iron complex outermembrane receptor protein